MGGWDSFSGHGVVVVGNELAAWHVGSGLRETQPDSGGNDHVF